MNSFESALLIICMQKDMFGSIKEPSKANEILSNICILIRKARLNKVPVFFAKYENDCTLKSSSEVFPTHLVPQIEADKNEDIIFTNKYPSCFRDTGLYFELKEWGVKNLVIAGVKTESGIDTTCRVASELGFSVVLISDAHTTIDNEFITAENIIQHHNKTLAKGFVTLKTTIDLEFF